MVEVYFISPSRLHLVLLWWSCNQVSNQVFTYIQVHHKEQTALQQGEIRDCYVAAHPDIQMNSQPYWMYILSFYKHALNMTFSSSKDRPTAWPLSLVSFGIPHTQLWVFPPLPSNEARRQRPDYLHWPRSVSSGRLPSHSCTGSRWHGEREKKGGGKQTLAPVSRPSSAGWWMSRTSRSLPPKPVESGYNELQSLG